MLIHLMSTRTLRLAIFALGTAMLTAVVSAPAKDKPLNGIELKNQIASAQTKADHEQIAQHFDAEAARYGAEAKEHRELAQLYQRNTGPTPTKYPGSVQSFQHCDSLTKSLEQAAEDSRQLAAEHRRMAQEAKR
jgi:hypothetical protein